MKAAKPSPENDNIAPPLEERVRIIRERMASGEWRTGRTSAELAEEWGVSESTVWTASSEASRRNREAAGTVDDIRTKLFGWLDEAAEFARSKRDAKAMAQVARTFGIVSGAAAPTKLALTDAAGKDLPPALAGMAGNAAALRFYAAHGRAPTPDELAAEEAAMPPAPALPKV